MPFPIEEARAAAYRLSVARRYRIDALRQRQLRGSEPAKRALYARWDWLLKPPVAVRDLPDYDTEPHDQPLA